MNIDEFIHVYKEGVCPNLFSSFITWGHIHQCMDSRGWILHDLSYNSQLDQLVMQFTDKSKLVIEAAANISLNENGIEIKEAKRVSYEWIDLLSSGLKSQRYYIDFINDGKTVLGKNNVHWSFIDVNDLSVKHAACILMK